MGHAFGIGWHDGSFVVQKIVFTSVVHDPQNGDTLADLDTYLVAGGFVAFHTVDKRVCGQGFLHFLGADVLQILADGIELLLPKHGKHFLFCDESGVHRVLDNQFDVGTCCVCRLPVEGGDSHNQVGCGK